MGLVARDRVGLAVLVASGACALVFEAVWSHWIAVAFGSSALATAATRAAFLAALASGAAVAARDGARAARPRLAGAALQGGIALVAMAMPHLIAALDPFHRALLSRAAASGGADGLASALPSIAALLVPAAMMGAAPPLLAGRAEAKADPGLGVGVSIAATLAGAAAGAGLARFALLPALGARDTNLAAAILSLATAAAAFAVGRRSDRVAEAAPRPPSDPGPAPRAVNLFAGAALAITGAAALAYGAAWTRVLALVLGPSPPTAAAQAFAALAGCAAGAWGATRFASRFDRPAIALALAQAGAAVFAFAGNAAVEFLPAAYAALHRVGGAPLASAGPAIALVAPPCLFLGASVAFAARGGEAATPPCARAVGRPMAVGLGGAAAGAFLAGVALVPGLGMQRALATAAIANLVCAAALMLFAGHGARARVRGLAAACFGLTALAAATARPWAPAAIAAGVWAAALDGSGLGVAIGERVVLHREGAERIVTVASRPGPGRPSLVLKLDGAPIADDGAGAAAERLLGLAGVLAHPAPANAAVFGMAAGTAAGSVLADRRVRSLEIVEREPAVVEASRFFEHVNGRPLKDPRTAVAIADPRGRLRTGSRRFELVVVAAPDPGGAVAEALTEEALGWVRARLEPGGVVVHGLRRSALGAERLRSFARVFPHAALLSAPGNDPLVLMGSSGPLDFSPEAIEQRMADPRIAEELLRAGLGDPLDVWARVVLFGGDLLRCAAGSLSGPSSSGAGGDAPDPAAFIDRLAACANVAAWGLSADAVAAIALRHAAQDRWEPGRAAEAALVRMDRAADAEAIAAWRERRSLPAGPTFAAQAVAGLAAAQAGDLTGAAAALGAAWALGRDGLVRDALAGALAARAPAHALELLVGQGPGRCTAAACWAAARALRALDRADEAIRWLETAEELDGRSADVAEELGRALAASGREGLALHWFEEAAGRRDRAAVDRAAAGEAALAAGDVERARARCGDAMRIWPRAPDPWRCAIRVACRNGDLAALEALAEGAAARHPMEVDLQRFRLAILAERRPERLSAARTEAMRWAGEEAVRSLPARACDVFNPTRQEP